MANTISAQTVPQTTAEYEAEFELLMQEAAQINKRMAADRIEIERLKAEAKAIRDETYALLASIEVEQQNRTEQRIQEIAERDQENLILRLEHTRLREECAARARK